MTTTTTARPRPPHRLMTSLWSLAVPAALAGATALWARTERARLPEPLAVHWGTEGPDRAGTFTELVTLPLAVVAPLFTLAMWALAFFLGHAALTRRIAAASSVWCAAMVSGVTATTIAVQLDAPDWTAAGDLALGSLLSAVGATALAALAAWLSPGDAPQPTSEPLPAGTARLELGEHELASWVRPVQQAGLGWLTALIVALCTVLGLATRSWAAALVLAVTLSIPLLGLTAWTVTVDRRGLTVASRLGRPRLLVPLEEIERVGVREVNPVREFGGWGVRTSVTTGSTGVVLRSGEAIEIHRTGGRRFLVTVDDAERGAALLATLAERGRRPA